MTNRLQQTAFATARASGLFRALRWWHRKDLLVLTYHSVARVDAATRRRYAPLYRNAVSAQHFEKQMRFLKRRYRVIGEDELLAFLDGGSLPERAALLTFDDGLKNNATVAWPILHRHDLPAFFFLPTAFLDDAAANRLRPHWSEELAARLLTDPAAQRGQFDDVLSDLPFEVPNPTTAEHAIAHLQRRLKTLPPGARREHLQAIRARLDGDPDPSRFPADRDGHSILATMTWDEARRMAREGAVMGAHTVHHNILTRLSDDEAAREIRNSMARVAEQTGAPCRWFAYPNGTTHDFTQRHQRALAEAGCRGAFTQLRGFHRFPPDDPMALRRIGMSPNYDLDTFRYVASGAKLLVDQLLRRRSY